jgi:acetyl-CoA C-acetyltransferase
VPRSSTCPWPEHHDLGHPIGATGAILVVKAPCAPRRTGGRYGLVTMCIGGGQGIAAAFEWA